MVRTWRPWVIVLAVLLSPVAVFAQTAAAPHSLIEWLMRVHQAARQSAYTGTFVVSAGGTMASAKIWHACDNAQQIERVVSLSGTPRDTYRRNDQVITFFPASKLAIAESRESLGLFPSLLKTTNSSIGDYYQFSVHGVERIAGLDAHVIHLVPKDRLRYGFKVWSDKKTGLVLQLQTLDLDGRVLEQAAFSELLMDAPIDRVKLSHMMAQTQGYRVERPDMLKTSADAQGWSLRNAVAGFKPMACYQRPVASLAGAVDRDDNGMQWVFSDGLATVSLFVEAFDGRRHVREGATALGGATHTLTRRINDWWVTAVGEVPISTLNEFVQGLERKK